MKAYKGFNKDMTCRGFQYEVGKEYKTDRAKICKSGFHACESPLDVWRYYPPVDGNRFCEVEQSGDIKFDGNKSASTKLRIGAEIGIPGLIKAHVLYTRSKAASGKDGGDGSNLAGGYRSNLAGGDRSNLAGGDRSNLAGGDCSNLAGGDRSNLAGGDYSNLAGGDYSNLAGGNGSNLAGGYRSNLAGGDYSNLAGGYRSNLAGGNYSNLAGGESSICIVRNGGKAKGGLRSVIVFTDWEKQEGKVLPKHVKTIVVDGKKYKPDTWYTLKDGEVVEAGKGGDDGSK